MESLKPAWPEAFAWQLPRLHPDLLRMGRMSRVKERGCSMLEAGCWMLEGGVKGERLPSLSQR
jgi:hypothetical protein